jgi:hypothetical protein
MLAQMATILFLTPQLLVRLQVALLLQVAVVVVNLMEYPLGVVVVLVAVAAMEAQEVLEHLVKVMLAALAHRVTQQILLLAVVVVRELLD